MATQADVRRIALSLPETEESPNHFAFSVRNKGRLKGFVWVWLEPVRLPAVTAHEPRPIIEEAWRCQAPKELASLETPARRARSRRRP